MGRFGLRCALLSAFGFAAWGGDWNARAAADYLDARQKAWFAWKPAQTPGGPCVSCHTGTTYLIARPALRKMFGEAEPTVYESGLLKALRARVDKREVSQIAPAFSKEPNASAAVGVESVQAALFLALDDEDDANLSPETEQALARMWALQVKDGKDAGAWRWFNLNLDPWETPDSPFFGATLAAMAVGSTPKEYRARPAVKAGTEAMLGYLQRGQQSQPLHNRLMLLWAGTKLPAAVSAETRKAIVADALRTQHSDGGWSMESLGPFQEHAAAPPSTGSNAYPTALTAFVLEQAGVPKTDPKLAKALAWLRSHQDSAGYWDASSMNKKFPAESMMVQFMRDAATAFAVLALAE